MAAEMTGDMRADGATGGARLVRPGAAVGHVVAPRPTTARGPRRLRGKHRKVWLLVHAVSALGWLGIDVVLAVLVFTGELSDDPAVIAVSLRALRLFVLWTLVPAGSLCLISGIVLGLGSKYGLFRYWWVAVKLVINIVLLALVLLVLPGAVDNAAEYGRAIANGTRPPDLVNIFMPPIVSATALVFAAVLSYFKPWGAIRRGT